MFPIRDRIPTRRTPVVTYGLIVLNLLVFIYQLSLGPRQTEVLFYLYGIVPARLTDAAWAAQVGLPFSLVPFLTTQFLHGDLFHLIGNLWMLWIFGDNVEDKLGRGRFLAFYLGCGFAAGGLHFLTNWSSQIPAVGASGAIAGVLGAYFLLYPTSRVLTLVPIFFYPLFVELPAFIFLGLWFLLQLFSGTASLLSSGGAGIAWWAHIGGFIAGMLWLRSYLRRHPPAPQVTYPYGPQGPPVIDLETPPHEVPPRDPRRRW